MLEAGNLELGVGVESWDLGVTSSEFEVWLRVRSWELKVGSCELEVGCWKLGVGSWELKLRAGTLELRVRS